MCAAESALQEQMDPAGSIWMPFVLHATRFLKPGGCLALVLPYEATYVRYARPLWRYLSNNFGRLRVVRTHERIFEDLLQEVIILLAENKGSQTGIVEYQVSNELVSLEEKADSHPVSIDGLIEGCKPFQYALLSSNAHELASGKLLSQTAHIGDLARIRIGYVAGDKDFFHPTPLTVEQFGLPEHSLHLGVAGARRLRGQGLFTDRLSPQAIDILWKPVGEELTDGETTYVRYGEAIGVSDRYKCSIRDPWYVVPGVSVPDLIFSVFSDNPLLLVNNGGLVASNSMLCGYLTNSVSAEQLAVGWYSSVAQLFMELEIHSLGGGVLVAVPRELSRVRIPIINSAVPDLQAPLMGRDRDRVRAIADAALVDAGFLSSGELDTVQSAISTLQQWRRR